MCTSLTFKAGNGNHFLARTMDFGFQLDGKPIVIPRKYKWTQQLGGVRETKFGFVGTGRRLEEYFVADGINEKGLSIAELYFLNEATYSSQEEQNKINLAPHEFIMWVLGEIESIADLENKIDEITIMNAEISLLGLVAPLHFILTDPTGKSVVVETNTGKIEIKDNPVGVMTNSPEFEWHLKNLNNYLSLRPINFPNQTIGDHVISPFGQGSGTYGLPGGYTSPERFVRTVYQRHFTNPEETVEEAVNAIFHILNGVTIPKGVNVKEDGSVDYTQYRAIVDVDDLTYYFNPYDTQEVFSVVLNEDLLNAESPIEFNVASSFKATPLNK